MSSYIADPRDHREEHEDTNRSSSPVPEKRIPWVIVVLVTGLIFAGFGIPAGTLIGR